MVSLVEYLGNLQHPKLEQTSSLASWLYVWDGAGLDPYFPHASTTRYKVTWLWGHWASLHTLPCIQASWKDELSRNTATICTTISMHWMRPVSLLNYHSLRVPLSQPLLASLERKSSTPSTPSSSQQTISGRWDEISAPSGSKLSPTAVVYKVQLHAGNLIYKCSRLTSQPHHSATGHFWAGSKSCCKNMGKRSLLTPRTTRACCVVDCAGHAIYALVVLSEMLVGHAPLKNTLAQRWRKSMLSRVYH